MFKMQVLPAELDTATGVTICVAGPFLVSPGSGVKLTMDHHQSSQQAKFVSSDYCSDEPHFALATVI